jgi:two-component system LytT family sensor kinase
VAGKLGIAPEPGKWAIVFRTVRCDERSLGRVERYPFVWRANQGYSGRRRGGSRLEIVLGMLFGVVVTASALAAYRFLASPGMVFSEHGQAMQAALHAATATLPHLRRGLSEETAAKAVPHLRALTGAVALAITDRERVLAVDGAGAVREFAGRPFAGLFEEGRDDRVHVDPRPGLAELELGGTIVAPLMVREVRIGSLAAFYEEERRIRPEDTRVMTDAASLVAAQLELAAVADQEERLAEAELRALRAQISPHFIYNALAAVASFIHTKPDTARELLTEFADFTRYAFSRERPYVTLADELHYVEKYLNLQRARFGERLRVRLEVAPEILPAVVPVLSLQPIVENAVRHGVEEGAGDIEIVGSDLGIDARVTVRDHGRGMTDEEVDAALGGRSSGIGLVNVHRRLQTSFGPEYGLTIDSRPGAGTTVALTVPKFRPGVRAA